ncbi:uncharacterized protein CCOS01_09261 [Colletotrichum costaricense]|uniref:Uncharacterized protein n=1 Tax=Colletotrichum costaricense TaxID=1209916 RepID=A0AAJ0DYU7_9PEZI|nr:uncharacterized protein CCOS01_09261 [Colletotrichum costaricense]KAK1524174.1 hypothetical protein CCOS01_09261 [Colletotrichum costaricense]
MHQQINHRPAEVVSAWWSVISFKADVSFFFFPLLFSVCLDGRHGGHTTIAAQDQKRHRSQAPTRRSCTMTSDSIPSRSSHVRWNAPPQIREGWCGLLQVDRAHLTSYMNGLTWSFFFNTAIPLKPAGARSSSIIIIIIRFKLAFEAFGSNFSAIILQWKKRITEYGPGPEQ